MINYFILSLFGIFTFKAYLDWRYLKHIQKNLKSAPSELSDRISQSEHQKAGNYTTAKLKLGMINYIISLSFLIFIFKSDFLDLNFSFFSNLSFVNNETLTLVMAYFGFTFIQSILHFPLSLYNTFVLEEKFGFNRTTFKTYILDLIKSTIISVILGGALLSIVFSLMISLKNWWLWAASAIVLFQLLLLFIYPKFLAPLFNKFTPIEDTDLLQKLRDLSSASGVQFKDYYLMDASRRSSHGNAYFTGFGKNKRIVLFDTLADKLSNDEIISVMAHELGHFKLKHILKMIVVSILFIYLGFFLIYFLYQQQFLFQWFGVDQINFANLFILTSLLFSPFSFLLSPLFSLFSRKNEFEADAFAAKQGHGENLVISLVKLMKDNASFSFPEPLYSVFYYSHPPVLERIKAIKNI